MIISKKKKKKKLDNVSYDLNYLLYILTFSLSWVPTVCVTMSLFFSDIGVHPVPYILSSEYFPTSIRSQVSNLYSVTIRITKILQ